MKKTTLLLFAALVVTLGAGCSKASKEDCEKAFDKMVNLELQGQSPEVAKLTKSMLEGTKGEFVKECDGKASKAEVECLLNAKDKAEFDKCN